MPLIRQLSNTDRTLSDLGGPEIDPVGSVEEPRAKRRRWTRLSRADVEDLVARYTTGASVADLARKLDVDRSTVRRHLAASGVRLRPAVSEKTVQRAIEIYESGTSLNQTARDVGMSPITLARKLRAANIEIRR